MITNAAILTLGFVVFSFNDIVDHAPPKHKEMILSLKMGTIAVLVLVFLILFVLMQKKMQEISKIISSNVPKDH